MMLKIFIIPLVRLFILGFIINQTIGAQSVSTSIPENIQPNEIYIFYLHGGVVQEQGPEAVSKYYGKYEYYAILDSLANRGFNIISEVRPKGTSEVEYAKKINAQMDTLLSFGVPVKNIAVVGASLGAYIALEVAFIANNSKLKIALLGLCSEYAINFYSPRSAILKGNFLSIYEQSDSKGSCQKIFAYNENLKFHEIELRMGIDHAFLFKPFEEWIYPLTQWMLR